MFIFFPILLIMLALAAVLAVAALAFAFLVLLAGGASSLVTGTMLIRTGWCLRRGSHSRGWLLAFTGMSATALIMVTTYAATGFSGHFSHWTHLLWVPALLCVYGIFTAPIDLIWSLTRLLVKLFRVGNDRPSQSLQRLAALKPIAAIAG